MTMMTLLGGDIQRCHGDGYCAVCGAECLVHDAHASRDHPAGDRFQTDTRQVICRCRWEETMWSVVASDDAEASRCPAQGYSIVTAVSCLHVLKRIFYFRCSASRCKFRPIGVVADRMQLQCSMCVLVCIARWWSESWILRTSLDLLQRHRRLHRDGFRQFTNGSRRYAQLVIQVTELSSTHTMRPRQLHMSRTTASQLVITAEY